MSDTVMSRPKRVLSFLSQFGGGGNHDGQHSNDSTPPASPKTNGSFSHQQQQQHHHPPRSQSATYSSKSTNHPDASSSSSSSTTIYNPALNSSVPSSPVTRPRTESEPKAHSRRNSMGQGYQPPLMDITQDTPAELQPVFSYLNSHSNKLYQEGYFLKLHDLDSRGRPSADRVWNECFAQLVGTVLSLWDAAQLDAAGDDGEVIPSFVNLTDASIKMIESLPMNGVDGQSLQNVLSISTAANNRYLLHFNSLHSLTQWTAGIRLAMYEHATLQEAYTGSILAGKGKSLNNIRTIMERTRFPLEDWCRVRFGAGTPWRRCWCVITPPDEKEFAKAQKSMKKKSAYDRSMPVVKGDVKFYESRKFNKKTRPIATVTDAFSAYGIYPQSKDLIEHSTLIKIEGIITIHTDPETSTEGFVFVMPEVHPAITGFEMMLRFLMPTLDTFALYGRPSRLIADVLDTRSLMFAMPTNRRYGYLELIDVAGLVHAEGSSRWNEREWRKQLKNLTSKRITAGGSSPANRSNTELGSRRHSRSSVNLPSTKSRSSLNLPSSSRNGIKFDDGGRSAPGSRQGSPAQNGGFGPPPRSDSVPATSPFGSPHKRAASANVHQRSKLSFESDREEEMPPPPPKHGVPQVYSDHRDPTSYSQARPPPAYESAQHAQNGYSSAPRIENYSSHTNNAPVNPVGPPPNMAHRSAQKPPIRPNAMPDIRRANSAIDAATLAQMKEASRGRGQAHTGAKDDSNYHLQYSGAPQPPPQGYAPSPSNSPYSYRGPPPHMQPGPTGPPPAAGMRQVRGPPPPAHGGGAMVPKGLPTIPGTPAVEQNNFDLPVQTGRREASPGSRSSSSVKRKPVGVERGKSFENRRDGGGAVHHPY